MQFNALPIIWTVASFPCSVMDSAHTIFAAKFLSWLLFTTRQLYKKHCHNMSLCANPPNLGIKFWLARCHEIPLGHFRQCCEHIENVCDMTTSCHWNTVCVIGPVWENFLSYVNLLVAGEFPTQKASRAESVSMPGCPMLPMDVRNLHVTSYKMNLYKHQYGTIRHSLSCRMPSMHMPSVYPEQYVIYWITDIKFTDVL